ncbi:Formate dehydrogenase region TAT target [Candidatus Filomicrobium marinum]|uniref:Formate dehydrogenase region TAT target n=2 Tax=Filomicrobium TaxID=119044 RepID=A0A0D6JDV6_9HYPH|nr:MULTISPECIES: twin-arginine translocation signal domain-containing protein [Filomicrobium]MCV0367963.1 twin-arginine translocation signal domain-containing protein [Filomicrobium sp.]CFX17212.1 Formate dehydrogenase region TAT target [Candidatus Filomicrobium marinum]CPR18210.1 Formate dehydrogenase region TAT target [Candidatus Filomicrobium marinum]SDO22345.1 formate dehydrogenase region TAT target [Filomicrobium insigne]
MQNDKKAAAADRRSFLKLAGASVVGGGAAAVAAASPALAAEVEAEPKPGQTYRESEHVKRYYELAKFM